MKRPKKKKIQLPGDASVIARCLLGNSSGRSDISMITPFWIYFAVGKKTWRFEHNNIRQITTNHHRLMGPLIGGSLLACFSIILLSRNDFDPFLLLTAFVAGLILTYYGWQGAEAITVVEKNDSTNIYLRDHSDALGSYLEFYNSYMGNTEKAMKIYHIAATEDWIKEEDQYTHPSLETERFIHASAREQILPTFAKHFPEKGDFILLVIDIQKLSGEVKFEYVDTRKELFPHIYGAINKTAVIATFPFENQNELKEILFNL